MSGPFALNEPLIDELIQLAKKSLNMAIAPSTKA